MVRYSWILAIGSIFLNALAGASIAWSISLSADSAAIRQCILENYYRRLPDSIARLPLGELLRHLDRYTRLITRQQQRQEGAILAGMLDEHSGVELICRQGRWIVYRVRPNSAAFDEDVHSGDVLLAFNGMPPREPDTTSAIFNLNWEPYSRCTLDLWRSTGSVRAEFQIRPFRTESIQTCVAGRTLAVSILDFFYGAAKEFRLRTNDIREEDIDTIVLDLRGNAGGYLEEAEELLQEFVPDGDTIWSSHTQYAVKYHRVHGPGKWRRPRMLYVLIDGATASSAELFTAGLMARTNAIIIGEQSFGKGRSQRFIQCASDPEDQSTSIVGALITTSIYYGGSVLRIDSCGLEPDIKSQFPYPSSWDVPDSIDVKALRKRYPYPTKALADSINQLVGYPVAWSIWDERARPLDVISVFNVLRSVLETKRVAYRPLNSTVYNAVPSLSADEEDRLRQGLLNDGEGGLTSRMVATMPLRSLANHLRNSAPEQRSASHLLERDVMGPFSYDLGIRIAPSGANYVVVGLVPQSSAFVAGVCIGDHILSVNDEPRAASADHLLVQIINAARQGRPVLLTLRRHERELEVHCEGTSRVTAFPLYHLTGGLGFIFADRFCTTYNGVYQIWHALVRMRADGMTTAVFDLRGVRSGRVDDVAKLLAHLLRSGDTIAAGVLSNGEPEVLINREEGNFSTLPVLLIVDSTTKGAAQIFAAALRRRGLTTLIGGRTDGIVVERRIFEILPGTGIAYVARRFMRPQDCVIVPDIPRDLPIVDQQQLAAAASQIDDLPRLRSWHWEFDEAKLDKLVSQLPQHTTPITPQTIAQIIHGDAARLPYLAAALSTLITPDVLTGP
jgi:C-terminal peptidase prc